LFKIERRHSADAHDSPAHDLSSRLFSDSFCRVISFALLCGNCVFAARHKGHLHRGEAAQNRQDSCPHEGQSPGAQPKNDENRRSYPSQQLCNEVELLSSQCLHFVDLLRQEASEISRRVLLPVKKPNVLLHQGRHPLSPQLRCERRASTTIEEARNAESYDCCCRHIA